jgi:hypothetical protein
MHISRFLISALVVLGMTTGMVRAEGTAIMLGGNAPQHERELATRIVTNATQAQFGALVKATFSSTDATAITRCLRNASPWTCMKPVLQGKNIHQLIIASVDKDTSTDGSPMIVVSFQVAVESLDSVIGDRRFCDHCTDDVLTSTTNDLARDQFHELAIRLGRTVIKVTSVPRGARITLDGKPFGATDASINTFPGTHTLVLELDKYQVEQRTVDAVEDKTVEVPAILRPAQDATVSGGSHTSQGASNQSGGNPHPHASRTVPLVVTGAGALAMVVGGALIVWNGKPAADPTKEQSPTYRDWTAPGIGLVVIGGAVAGFGGYLWWKAVKSDSMATISPMPGGAVVGVTKSF